MDILDIEQLMDNVLKLSDDEIYDEPDYDQLIFDKFGVEVEQFATIASELMNFTMAIESPLTKKMYQGFVDVAAQCFICKQDYKPNVK